MNDDRHEGELHAWIDPEVEARIVAMILGEASDFEREDLERIMAERPELRIFKRRLEVVHSLMSEALKSANCEKWRLSPERRAEVMEVLGIGPEEEVVVLPVDGRWERRVRWAGVRVAMMAAACLVVSLVLVPFLWTEEGELVMDSGTIVNYMAADESGLEDVSWRSADVSMESAPAARGPVAGGGIDFGVSQPSDGEVGGSAVRRKLTALKSSIGRGGVLVDDGIGLQDVERLRAAKEEHGTMDPVALSIVPTSRSVPAAPTEPEIPMPEVDESFGPTGGTWAIRGDSGGAATKRDGWKSDAPADPGTSPKTEAPGVVQIAGKKVVEDRFLRREVPPSPLGFDGFMDYAQSTGDRSEAVGGDGRRTEPEVAFELPVLGGFVGEVEPDYDTGIAADRRDGYFQRYSSDNSAGYRWSGRAGTVTGFPSQTNHLVENGDDGVDLPDENELFALQDQIRSDRMARTEPRPAEVREEVVEFEKREKDVENLGVDLDKSVGSLREILQTQLNLTESRLEKMGQVVNERRDLAVDKALESHDYIESKREYESAQAMLQSMKLQSSSKRISLNIPKSPITVHEDPTVKKKSSGFLGLGTPTYEGKAVLQVNPSTPDLDGFGGNTGNPVRGNMTRQFFATEFEVVEAEKTLDRVVDELGLEKKWGTNKAGAIRRLKDAVKTEQVRGTDLIEIKVEEKNAADAKLIAERVAKSYQKRRTAMEQDRAEKALASLDAELRDQEDVVEEKRKVLDTIVQSIGIPYVEGVRGSGEMGRSQEQIYELAERNLYELEKEKQQLELQIKTMLKLKGKERMEYAAGLQLPQNGVTSLYATYREATRDLEKLKASGMGAKHPDVAMRMLNVDNLRTDLEKSVGSLREETSVDLSPGPTAAERKAEAKRQKDEARRLAEQKKREALLEMEKSASVEAFSTFSLHVSDVSFKLAQAALAKGEWPESVRIRVEEFVNAFDYGDPAPSQDEKVACALEQAAHPFMQQRNMLRISMRTAAVGRAAGTPLRLTVLLDNSGSMERSDRAESVKRAFELLAAQMNPQDEVTLISFARTPRLLRDSVSGDRVMDLVQVISDTPSEGGTNLEEALRLGLEKAREDFQEGAQNRIILLTDGAANLGNAEPELLGAMVEKMRQQGIAFDACGVGADGLNDDVLEALTRKGDGRYYFLDRPEDADAGFAKQIAGALRPAAKNVKVQVEFNPKRVGRYRLYGFEKHELKKEDFRNDRVDAAEMAAEEAGVAMYQVETLPDGEGDVGSVSVRFMDMASGRMVEKRWPIPYETNPASLADAAPSMKLAASAAFLGEKLKGSPVGDLVELGTLSGMSRSLQPVYPLNERVGQLIEMIEKARAMAR